MLVSAILITGPLLLELCIHAGMRTTAMLTEPLDHGSITEVGGLTGGLDWPGKSIISVMRCHVIVAATDAAVRIMLGIVLNSATPVVKLCSAEPSAAEMFIITSCTVSEPRSEISPSI